MVELAGLDQAVFGGTREPGTSRPFANQVAGNLNSAHFPLVTIGLPVFNGATTLAAALETLVRQDYPNLQIIISDNASTDGTLAICEEFARGDPRIRIIRKQVNEGAVANFRTVLDAAEGEFFMWAAADDYWYPHFISRLLPALRADSAAGVAMCAVDRRLPDGAPFDLIRFIGDMNPNGMGHLRLLGKILSGAKYNLFIYGLFRKPLLQRAMRHFPVVLGGDRQFIAQMALACRFAYVDEILLTRTHQPKNFDAYMETMAKRGTLRRQMISFAGTILGSSVIPWWRKACLPVALMQYFMLSIPQKQFKRLNMIKIIARKFFISPRSLVMAIGLFGVSAVIGGFLAYLNVISSEFAVGTLSAAWLLVAAVLLNRGWAIRAQKSIERKLSGNDQEINRTLRELRYLSDTLLHPDLAVARTKSNQLSDHAVQRIEKHRKVVEFVRNLEDSRIREVYVQELFPGIEKESVPIGVINELTGHANKTDMLYVSAVAKHIGAKKMFEFGTYMGRTTFHLAHNNPDGQVFTLNLPPERDPRYAPYMGVLFKGREEEKRITQIHSDSREFDTAPYRQQFDFVFVDGDHSYDLVKNDTQKAFELIKQGGVIMWHDYAPKSDGLVRFFKEFTQDRPLFRIRSTCLLVYIDGVDVMNHKLGNLPHSLELEYREENPYLVESIYHS
ncbi:glycosyltransferase [Sulfurimicrobium lacus]|uniref:glycosyltransferase n=1 Tax=Sulfurimicrobium lacus TaxID=2715678 RepID=UPI0015667B38|nr:glycosyltransferase [Sulfurimicrobium lacus]